MKNFTSNTTPKTYAESLYIILFLVTLLGFSTTGWGQTTMAHFGLNGNLNPDVDNVVGTPSATQNGLTSSTNNECEGNGHYYCDGSNDYLQILINTTGFSNISISWQQRNYDANNGRWNLIGDFNNDGTTDFSITNNPIVTVNCATVSVSLPPSFNNQSNVRLRLTSNLTGGESFYIDDVTISGYTPGSSQVIIYSYTGSNQTFTVPNCVNSVNVECWGGGGGANNSNNRGGGGGAYSGSNYVSVTPGTSVNITVGRGGDFNSNNGSGGNSSFGTSVIAAGAVGATGGTVNGSTGTTRFAGGNGGSSTSDGGAGGGGSGGAGGAGGNGGNSNNNNGGAAGTAGAAGSGSPGAAGGAGGSRNNDGNPGVVPGGGGGERGSSGDISGSGAAGRVIVRYSLPNNPTITLTNNIASVNYSASTQNVTFAYSNLTGCPDRYSIDFASGITDITDATLSASPITVTLPAGLAIGTYNGTLTVRNSSYGFVSTTYNIQVTITAACTPPTTQASNITFPSTGNTTTTVEWNRGDGTGGVIVVGRLTSTAAVLPASGIPYIASPEFGLGTQIGTDNYVVYKGIGTSVNVTGLASASNYTFTVYEYNTTGTCYLTPGSSGSVSTNCTPPATQATIGSFTNNTTGTSLTVNFSGGSGSGRIVVARLTSTTAVDPSSGVTYTANASFGSGTGTATTGTGNYVVYVGTGTSVNITGLTGNTNYTFTVYEYGSGPCYKTPGSSSPISTPLAYCTSVPQSSSGYITIVNLNTINNTTGYPPTYNNYTSISTNLETNQSYTLTITIIAGGYTCYGYAWIDWNQDGEFSSSEGYSLGNRNTNGTLTANFTVPTGATPGSTRMRVSLKYGSDPGPCEIGFYGEVEDYGIVVQPACAPSGVTASNNSPLCTGSTLNLTSSVASGDTPFTYSWTGPNGFTSSQQNPSISNVTTDHSGTYQVTISNSCGSTSYSTEVTVFPEVFVSPSAPSVCQGSTIALIASGGPVNSSSTTTPLTEPFNTSSTAFSEDGYLTASRNTTYKSEGTSSFLLAVNQNQTSGQFSQTNSIDLSGSTSAVLTFSHICLTEPGWDFGYIEYSTNGGTDWTTFPASSYPEPGRLASSSVVRFDADSYTDWGPSFNNSMFKTETISIPQSALTTNFRIRFRMTTDDSFLYLGSYPDSYSGWFIDNLKISATTVATTSTYTWSPITGLFTDPDAITPYTTGSNSATVYAKPSTTTTYTVTINSGTVQCSKNVTVTVIPPSVAGPQQPSSSVTCINTTMSFVVHNTTGATGIARASGLPAGVSAAFGSNKITISGIPTESGTFNYTIPLLGGCGSGSASGTLEVTALNTVTDASPGTTTVCVETAISPITHQTTGATGIGTPVGLPTGVTAAWSNHTITINGTPTVSGSYLYNIPLTGGCGTIYATGTINVTPKNTVSPPSSSPSLCINTPIITPITIVTTGASGIGSPTSLPPGINANWADNTITISGTPSSAGTFNYSIPLTGGCGTIYATGTITVNANNTVTAQSSSPTPCIGTSMTAITHNTTGATGIGTATGLPTGVTAIWSSGTITISGTPTTAGKFDYSIPLTGGCGSVSATGSFTVIEATVNAEDDMDAICQGTPSPSLGGYFGGAGATGAVWSSSVGGTFLPSNAWSASTTWTPPANFSGPAILTLTTQGTCSPVSDSKNITVNPSQPVSVTITSNPPGPICEGTEVTFTATPTNGGTTPYYQWQLNGSNTGSNQNTFTTSNLKNGDRVKVVLTSNILPCPTGNPATSNEITTTVNANKPVSVTIVSSDPDNDICQGTSVTFTATPTNGGTNPSYQWKLNGTTVGLNQNTFTTPGLANGDAISVILTSNITPCALDNPATSNTITTTVHENQPVSVTIASSDADNTICEGTPVTFTATPTNEGSVPSYQWKLNDINVGTNQNTFTTSLLKNGDKVKVVLTSNITPCATENPATSNEIPTTVNENQPVSVSITSSDPDNLICQGSEVTFTATPINPGDSPQYQWKLNGNPVGSDQSTYTTTGLNNLDEIIVILTSNITPCAVGNPATSNKIVTRVNPTNPVSVSITLNDADNEVCKGTSVTFTATPVNAGSSPLYKWFVDGIQVGGNNSTYSYVPTDNDQVYVTLTSDVGCGTNNPATSNIIDLVVNDPPSVDAGAEQTIYNGAYALINAHVSGTEPLTFSWTPSELLEDSSVEDPKTVNLDATRNFTLKVTDGNGCTNEDMVTINIIGPPLAVAPTASEMSVCSGTPVQLFANATGGTPSYTYTWTAEPAFSSSDRNPWVTPTETTIYQISVFDGFGTTSATITISVKPNPTVSVNTETICSSETATIQASPSGGTSPYTYDWTVPAGVTNPGNVQSFQASVAGEYSVVVTDTEGCSSDPASGTLTVNPIPTVTVNSPTICASEVSATITANVSDGTGPFSYAWTVPPEFTPNPGNVSFFTANVAGTYSVIVTDAKGCSSISSSGILTIHPNPIVTVNNPVICASEGNASIEATATNGTTPYSYSWTVPSGAPIPGNKASFYTTVGGNYTVIVTDNNTCSTQAEGILTINENPTVTVNSPTICASDVSAIITANPSGGVAPYTYAWTVPAGATAQANDVSSFDASVAGTYSVIVTDAKGCSSPSASGILTINPNPTVTVNSPAICADEVPATVTALPAGGQSPFSFNWTVPSGATAPGNNSSFTTSTPGTYSVIITDANNCTSSPASGTVTIHALPSEPQNNGDVFICNNQSIPAISVTVGSGETADWYDVPNGGSPLYSGNTSFTPSSSGTWYAEARNVSTGCTSTARTAVKLTVNPVPTAIIALVGIGSVCQGSQGPKVRIEGEDGIGAYKFIYRINNSAPQTVEVPLGQNYYELTATTDNPGTITYYLLSVTDDVTNETSCVSTLDQSVTVTVIPTPVVNTIVDQVKCHGTSNNAVTFSGSTTNSYSWENSGLPSIGIPASGTGTILQAYPLTNTGTSPVDAMITVTPSFTDGIVTCTGNSVSFSITVNPAAQVNHVPNIELCNGSVSSPITFSTNNTGGITTFKWTNSNPTIGLPASGNGNINSFTATNTGNTPVVSTISVTPYFSNKGLECTGTPITFTITVKPVITLTISPADQTVCSGSAITDIVISNPNNVPNTTFSWDRTNTTILTGISNSGTSSPITGTLTSAQPDALNTTVFTISAVSANGCSSSSTATVSVGDITPPAAHCQPVDLILDATGNATLTPAQVNNNSSDNCTPIANLAFAISKDKTTYGSSLSYNCLDVGISPVYLKVTDATNHSSTCEALVRVIENIPPTVTCKNHSIYLNTSGNASISLNDVFVSSSDNCTPVENLQITLSKTNFDCSNIGDNDVVVSAKDLAGNVGTCVATVTVIDNIPPVANCRDYILELDDNTGMAVLYFDDIDNESNDNCSEQVDLNYTLSKDNINFSPNLTFSCSELQDNTVYLMVTDGSGNSDVCSANVHVRSSLTTTHIYYDNCDGRFKLEVTGGKGPYTYFWDARLDRDGNPQNYSPFSNGAGSYTQTSTEKFPLRNPFLPNEYINIKITVTDENGCYTYSRPNGYSWLLFWGQSESNAVIAYPQVCRDQVVTYYSRNKNSQGGPYRYFWEYSTRATRIAGGNTEGYNSDFITVQWNTTGGPYEIRVSSYPITSGTGCSAVDIFSATVHDLPNPVFQTAETSVCPGKTQTYSLTTSNFSKYAWTVTGGEIVSGGNSPSATILWGTGPNGQVSVEVTNENGCKKSISHNVTIVDNENPVIACPEDKQFYTDALTCDVTGLNLGTPVTSDNCTVANITNNAPGTFGVGDNTVRWTVTDGKGNASYCDQKVTIIDNKAPIVKTKNIEINLGATGMVTISPDDIDDGSSDNCGIASRTLSKYTFDCYDLGDNTVVLTVTDYYDNAWTGNAIVKINDAIVPTYWDGGGNNDNWNNPQNWSTDVVPNRCTDVVIPELGSFPIISTKDAVCRNLTIQAKGKLTINPNCLLTIGGKVSIHSSSVIESGSLIAHGFINKGFEAAVVSYFRQMRSDDWHYFSSPVGNLRINDFMNRNTGEIEGIWSWNEPMGDWENLTNHSSLFESGKGYNLGYNNGDGKYEFTGSIVRSAVATATSPFTITYYSEGDRPEYDRRWVEGRTEYGAGGWNLLGNPFTSALKVAGPNGFLDMNDGSGSYTTNKFDPNYVAVWIYDGDYGDYGRYYYIAKEISFTDPMDDDLPENLPFNGNNNIQAGQGFFVLAHQNDVKFNFEGSTMQTHDTEVPLKSSGIAWPGIRLKVRYGNKVNSTLIVYNDGMSAGLDPGYDIGLFSSGPEVEIYTTLVENDEGVYFARQLLPLINHEKMVIPVGVDCRKGSVVTFFAYTVPLENGTFFLEDRLTGVFTDLRRDNYTVTLPENTTGTGRFFIHSSHLTSTEQIKANNELNLSIWSANRKLFIEGSVTSKSTVSVYDMLGRKIYESRLQDERYNTFELPSVVKGVYMVRVDDGARTTTRKVVF